MRLELKRGPVPLFHQISEALRYRIATGRLKLGDRLPAVRKAAEDWGVNLHTVRRAYAVIERDGLVETRTPGGTRVIDGGPLADAGRTKLDSFLARVIEQARRDHGLSRDALASRIQNWSAGRHGPTRRVHFVECSRSQALGHARELEAVFRVRAQPWSLSEPGGELPAGDLVATYFHYSELRERWPDRLRHVRFVPIRPDSSLIHRLPRKKSGSTTLQVCELEEAKALQIASDLRSMIPERFELSPRVLTEPNQLLASRSRSPILFAPRLWGALTAEERTDPRALEVRYRIHADELEALGHHFGWPKLEDRPT